MLNASKAHERISTVYSGAWKFMEKVELRDAVLKTSLEASIEQKTILLHMSDIKKTLMLRIMKRIMLHNKWNIDSWK